MAKKKRLNTDLSQFNMTKGVPGAEENKLEAIRKMIGLLEDQKKAVANSPDKLNALNNAILWIQRFLGLDNTTDDKKGNKGTPKDIGQIAWDWISRIPIIKSLL